MRMLTIYQSYFLSICFRVSGHISAIFLYLDIDPEYSLSKFMATISNIPNFQLFSPNFLAIFPDFMAVFLFEAKCSLGSKRYMNQWMKHLPKSSVDKE